MDWPIYSLCLAGFEASLVAGRKFAEGALFEAGGVNFSGKHFYYSAGITPSCPTKSYNLIYMFKKSILFLECSWNHEYFVSLANFT